MWSSEEEWRRPPYELNIPPHTAAILKKSLGGEPQFLEMVKALGWALQHKGALSRFPDSDLFFVKVTSPDHIYIAIVELADERASWLNLEDIIVVV